MILNYIHLNPNTNNMAKTINKDIDIYNSLTAAKKAFDKSTVSCDLLKTSTDYYIDRSKTALKAWPNLYTLVETK